MNSQPLNLKYDGEITDSLIEACLVVRNANNPYSPSSLAEFRSSLDLTPPGKVHDIFLATRDGQPAAYCWVAENHWSEDSQGKFEVSPNVRLDLPDRADVLNEVIREGIARARSHGASTVDIDTRDDFPESLELIRGLGFEERMRFPYSVLGLSDFDLAPFEGAIEKVQAQGMEILNGPQLAERWPDWKNRYWELEMELIKDIPYVDGLKEEPFEEWIRWLNDPVVFHPETWWVCVEGDRWLGTTCFRRCRTDPACMSTGLTGVRREARRRGIATALKVHAILDARSKGGKWINTDNEENNPMYQLNVALGFKAAWHWVLFRQDLAKL